MKQAMRAVIYARYSSDNQRDASIDDQIRTCTAFAKSQGWRLVGSYADRAISGASFLRPGYQQVLHDAARLGFDVVVAEALDRISRDQADTATFYKHLSFHGVQLVTLSEGRIDELHVGLKGTMNALFLKDLAMKTRRGLEGRVRQGRSGGGISYGYDLVPGDVGARLVNPAEAEIVRRIFREYSAGASPRAIAAKLNLQRIPGPRHSPWGMSTIYGNWRRGTGILNNEAYVGRLVWNRQRFIKDPGTGKRQARPNVEENWVVEAVPALRIIDEDLWNNVKARQALIRGAVLPTGELRPERARRPRYLFSGLIACGVCNGGYTLVGARVYGCANARNRGTCTNRLTIKRDVLEASVLAGLKDHLLHPTMIDEFIQEYQREYNRAAVEAELAHEEKTRELEKVRKHIQKIIEAIREGLRSPSVIAELERLEKKRSDLEQELMDRPQSQLRLHPGLVEVYRRKVSDLVATLNVDATRGEAVEILRSLVDQIRLVPDGATLHIELVGALAGILSLTNERPRGGTSGAQVTLVAGIGFEPMTFRL